MSENGGAPTQAPRPGLSLAGYRDLTEVGHGGSGVVFRAWQPDFNRWVAIKVMPIGADAAPMGMFTRERLAAGTLSGHPNIVTVHDAGVTPERTAFIVMEYLPDGTVADQLRGGPLPWPEAVAVGVKLSGALESAHRAGVLHLDVKPENLFIVRDYDTVKLGDFGIARVAGNTATRSGTISGTLLHMAPEVLQDHPPTVASDVYSLGSTLFALICGHPPFGRVDEAPGVVIARILGEPAPVGELASRGLPPSFGRIIEQALAKNPDERQPSAAVFGEQLRTAQAEAGLPSAPMLVRGSSPNGPEPGGAGGAGGETMPPAPTPVEPDEGDPGPTSHAGGRRNVLLIGIASLVLVVASASAAVVRGGTSRSSAHGIPPAPTLATLPPNAPGPAFMDDFSNRSTGWTYYKDVAYYDNEGGYRIRVNTTKNGVIGKPRMTGNATVAALASPGADVSIEADATFISDTRPSPAGGVGLFCRMQSADKARYQAVVFPTGQWQITRERANTPPQPLAHGNAVLPLIGGVYHIRFECGGNGRPTRLRLAVGGQPIGEAVDPNGLDRGEVGVVAISANAPGVEAHFDNFVATRS